MTRNGSGLNSCYLGLMIMLLIIVGAPGAHGAGGVAACGADKTVEVCVTSAVLTSRGSEQDGDSMVRISLSLQVVNLTQAPIAVSLPRDPTTWSFAPLGADSITATAFSAQGVTTCHVVSSCKSVRDVDYTLFVPGKRQNVQLVLHGRVPGSVTGLLRNSSRATLAGLLSVVEKGQHRFVPIPLPEFEFVNALAGAREQ